MLYRLISLLFIIYPFALCASQYDYKEVQNYLNEIHTLKANFIQSDKDLPTRKGRILISKPGKIKWEYDEPNKITIIANQGNIIYYDHELEEVSYVSSKSLILSFLSRENLSLNDDVKINNYIKRKDHSLLFIEADKKSEEEANISELVLNFQNYPFKLLKISVFDINDDESEIILKDLETNIEIDDSEFNFRNPKFFKGIY